MCSSANNAQLLYLYLATLQVSRGSHSVMSGRCTNICLHAHVAESPHPLGADGGDDDSMVTFRRDAVLVLM